MKIALINHQGLKLTSLFSCAWSLVKEIIDAIRCTFPGVVIVVGGKHPTAAADMVLKDGKVEYG
jgi:hypothetical protein